MKHVLLFFIVFVSIKNYAQDASCGTSTDTAYFHTYKNSIKTIKQIQQQRLPIINVPIQIHLFTTSSGNSFCSITEIRTELTAVNILYANAGIHLQECFQPNIIAVDSLYNYTSNDMSALMNNYYTPNVINLYFPNSITLTGGPVSGFSSPPPSADYAFIASGCGSSGATTIAHELGHYFGLPHTHDRVNGNYELVNGSNCAIAGDLLCDTPADPNLYGLVDASCSYTGTLTDPNNVAYTPNTSLIMSYSLEFCKNNFSAMQYALMNYTLVNSRANLSCASPSSVYTLNTNETTRIYPNPATGSVTIDLSTEDEAIVRIMDIHGKEILNQKLNVVTEKLDISAIKNGYYFLLIEDSGLTKSFPLVIINPY